MLLAAVLFFVRDSAFPVVHADMDRVFYVAKDGDDLNQGTSDDPWRTVQYAVNKASPGDNICVRGGTYHESIKFHRSGEQGSPISLTNCGDDTVTLDGGGNAAILDYGTRYWIIEGLTLVSSGDFTVDHGASWGIGTHHWIIRDNKINGTVVLYGSYNLFESNEVDGSRHNGNGNGVWEFNEKSHHNIYRQNHIHDFSRRGFWSMDRTHDSIFEDNHVHHLGWMCIDTDGATSVVWRHTIRSNTIHDCGEEGIEMENTFDSIVENNIIYDTTGGIGVINYGWDRHPEWDIRCEAGGEYGQYGDTDGDDDCEGDITNIIIRQNLIYNGQGWGGILIIHAGGVKIWGNTIFNNVGPGIGLECSVEFCPEIEIRGNIINENTEVAIRADPASLVANDHNLFSEPRFVDPLQNNFHLRAKSTAIDNGFDIGLSVDLDGNPRPQGAEYDIGAYEYVSPWLVYLSGVFSNLNGDARVPKQIDDHLSKNRISER